MRGKCGEVMFAFLAEDWKLAWRRDRNDDKQGLRGSGDKTQRGKAKILLSAALEPESRQEVYKSVPAENVRFREKCAVFPNNLLNSKAPEVRGRVRW